MPDEGIEDAVRRIAALVEGGAVRRARLLLIQLHPADQADALSELDGDLRPVLIDAMRDEEVAKLTEYLDEEIWPEVAEALGEDRMTAILAGIPDDEAAYVLHNLPNEQAEALLERLGDQKVEELVSYEEDSAGGRMSSDVILLRDWWTVGRAIEFLRRQPVDLAQMIHLFVVNEYDELVGSVTAGHLVMNPGQLQLSQIMEQNPLTVPLEYDQEEAAERMRHYNLLAMPVVDEEGHVRGVLTADEILDIQVEEATEDIYHLAGLLEEERIFRPIREAAPPRLAWLLFNLSTAFVGALVIHNFEGTIERVAALAVFMPLVAGMAGNAGLQTLTLVVRSIALGEIEVKDAMHVLRHEIVMALINGICLGLLVGMISWQWKGSGWLGLIVGGALMANVLSAMINGVLIPVTLKRLKKDPALASGVIVMLSDAVGFLLLLGTATALISKLE